MKQQKMRVGKDARKRKRRMVIDTSSSEISDSCQRVLVHGRGVVPANSCNFNTLAVDCDNRVEEPVTSIDLGCSRMCEKRAQVEGEEVRRF